MVKSLSANISFFMLSIRDLTDQTATVGTGDYPSPMNTSNRVVWSQISLQEKNSYKRDKWMDTDPSQTEIPERKRGAHTTDNVLANSFDLSILHQSDKGRIGIKSMVVDPTYGQKNPVPQVEVPKQKQVDLAMPDTVSSLDNNSTNVPNKLVWYVWVNSDPSQRKLPERNRSCPGTSEETVQAEKPHSLPELIAILKGSEQPSEEEHVLRQIRDILGIHANIDPKYANISGRPWTDEEDNALKHLTKDKLSLELQALILGRSKSATEKRRAQKCRDFKRLTEKDKETIQHRRKQGYTWKEIQKDLFPDISISSIARCK